MNIKHIVYWCLARGPVGWILRSEWIVIVASTLGAGALLYLDIFGSDDDWVKENSVLAFRVFLGILLAGVIYRLLRLAARWASGRGSGEGSAVNELFVSVGRIVQRKSNRFRNALPEIAGRHPFGIITQPEEQIKAILEEANDYFRRQQGIFDHELDVTVLKLDRKTSKWEFIFVSNLNRKRSDPGKLMSQLSCAADANRTGVAVFHPSKDHAAKRHRYCRSRADKKDGSIFCYPVKLDIPGGVQEFVLTFATYNCTLCNPDNPIDISAVKFVLNEFSRRIELELILWTIKDFKRNEKKPQPRRK